MDEKLSIEEQIADMTPKIQAHWWSLIIDMSIDVEGFVYLGCSDTVRLDGISDRLGMSLDLWSDAALKGREHKEMKGMFDVAACKFYGAFKKRVADLQVAGWSFEEQRKVAGWSFEEQRTMHFDLWRAWYTDYFINERKEHWPVPVRCDNKGVPIPDWLFEPHRSGGCLMCKSLISMTIGNLSNRYGLKEYRAKIKQDQIIKDYSNRGQATGSSPAPDELSPSRVDA